MRVDILTSGTPPGQLGTITRTILQNIEVLSAGQSLDRDGQGKPSTVQVVNLLVTPQEAERLSLASGQMKVQLVLRNPLDVTTVQTAGISAAGLLIDAPAATAPHRRAVPTQAAPAVAPAVAHPEPKPVPVTVEVIHGSKKDAVVIGYTTPDKKEVAQ
jgi:pilus assembly protein CpaB